jgi:hypothetical protein
MEQLIEPNDGQSVADVLLCTFEVQLLCIVYFISCYRENFCKQSMVIVPMQHCLTNEALHREG